jgi:RNA polymerase sigma-70 factor (ECF subfamily)
VPVSFERLTRLAGFANSTAAAIQSPAAHRRPEEEVVLLFEQFRVPLLRYLSGLGLALADCEEVIQDAFLSLFLHLDRGKPRDNIRGWLFRVAHNLGLKRRERIRRDLEACSRVGHAEDIAVDPCPSPEDQLEASRKRKIVLSVVEALAHTDRQCLILRAEGLRYREIAGILGTSLGSVSGSLARTLARIARATER